MSQNLYKRNGIWYARVKVRGRDIRKSLYTGSKVKATKFLQKYLNEAADIRVGTSEWCSWKEAVVEWSGWASENLGQNTLERYKTSLRMIGPYLEELYVDQITKAKIVEIVWARRKASVLNATIRRDLTAISSVLDVCEEKGWVEENATLQYNRRRIKEKRDPIILPNADDIEFVINRAPGNFAKMIEMAQHSGLRQEEIASMEHSQIRSGAVDLPRTKTNRPRSVPIDGLMCKAGDTIRSTVRYLHSTIVFHHSGMRYRNVASRFREIVRSCIAEAEAGKQEFRTFRFHDLRHWFAVDYLRRGGNIYRLQKILGHSSIKTTELYLDYLTPEEAERAMNEGAQNGAHL